MIRNADSLSGSSFLRVRSRWPQAVEVDPNNAQAKMQLENLKK